MIILFAAAALAGLYVWKSRQEPAQSPECAALEAELDVISDSSAQTLANLAVATDPAMIQKLTSDVIYWELQWKEKAALYNATCADEYHVWKPNL